MAVYNEKNSTGRRKNYSPSRVKDMSPIEAAWIGAFIEGEGSVGFKVNKRQNSIKYGCVDVTNTDPEMISVLLRVVGAGSVSMSFQSSPLSRKPIFHWCIRRRREIEDIISQCRKYSPKLQNMSMVLNKEVCDAYIRV